MKFGEPGDQRFDEASGRSPSWPEPEPFRQGGFAKTLRLDPRPGRYELPSYLTTRETPEVTPPASKPALERASSSALKTPFKHDFHVILDVLSCGFWLPVHILLATVH